MDNFILAGRGHRRDILVRTLLELPAVEPEQERAIYRTCAWVWSGDHKNVCRVRVFPIEVPEASTIEPRWPESAEHRALKLGVANWLKDRGFDAGFERAYPHSAGVADVRSDTGKILVECGTTQRGKIIDGVSAGWSVGYVEYGEFPIMLLFDRIRGVPLDTLFSLGPSKDPSNVDIIAHYTRSPNWDSDHPARGIGL